MPHTTAVSVSEVPLCVRVLSNHCLIVPVPGAMTMSKMPPAAQFTSIVISEAHVPAKLQAPPSSVPEPASGTEASGPGIPSTAARVGCASGVRRRSGIRRTARVRGPSGVRASIDAGIARSVRGRISAAGPVVSGVAAAVVARIIDCRVARARLVVLEARIVPRGGAVLRPGILRVRVARVGDCACPAVACRRKLRRRPRRVGREKRARGANGGSWSASEREPERPRRAKARVVETLPWDRSRQQSGSSRPTGQRGRRPPWPAERARQERVTIPSFFSREASVVGLTPRRSAAPPRP